MFFARPAAAIARPVHCTVLGVQHLPRGNSELAGVPQRATVLDALQKKQLVAWKINLEPGPRLP